MAWNKHSGNRAIKGLALHCIQHWWDWLQLCHNQSGEWKANPETKQEPELTVHQNKSIKPEMLQHTQKRKLPVILKMSALILRNMPTPTVSALAAQTWELEKHEALRRKSSPKHSWEVWTQCTKFIRMPSGSHGAFDEAKKRNEDDRNSQVISHVMN